jgi:hypothetical protein
MRIRGYFSKSKVVREQTSVGNTDVAKYVRQTHELLSDLYERFNVVQHVQLLSQFGTAYGRVSKTVRNLQQIHHSSL